MRQLLSSLIRNQGFQDASSVLRGIYRIGEGMNEPANNSLFIYELKQQQNITERTQPKQPEQNPLKEQVIIETTIEPLQSEETQATPKSVEFNENRVLESSWSRAMQFGYIGARIASKTMFGMVTGSNFKDAMVNEQNAKLLARGLCKMRGAPLKLAQVLSIQEDKLIPENIRMAFEIARQTADIMPQSQLNKVLKAELGDDWIKRFDYFENMPFAAASIGQVHKGIIGGKEVAVKIQYPGVKESIDSDMSNLKRLLNYTNIFPKNMFFDRIISYTKNELHEECDYIQEALKQERYRKMLSNLSREYIIPSVYQSFSTSRIITGDYLKGEDLDQVAANQPQYKRNDIGKRIMDLTLRELFEFRYMQTDPNPSNFYYKQDTDQLILLDFGAVREYSKQFMDIYIDIIYGSVIGDRDLCLKKSIEIGFLTGEETLRMKDAHVDSVMAVGEPFCKDGEFDFGGQMITDKVYQLLPVMLRERMRPPPQEVYSLHRKLSGAYLMNMKLKSKINCKDVFLTLYEQYKLKNKAVRAF